ncbi:hypothetical protein Ancab_019671 [Ancistrocladus abbreviatus]
MDLVSIEAPQAAVDEHEHEADCGGGGWRWKVLVVDYDQAFLSALEQMLRSCNFNAVTKCGDGKGALSMLQEDRNRFDLIITERHLPNMDGLELLKHAGMLNTDLPLILMSSEDGEEAIKEAIGSGACEYLVKPIRIEDVRHLWKHAYRMQKKNVLNGVVEQSAGFSNEKGASDGEHTSDGECNKCSKRCKSKQFGGVLHDDDAPIPARKKQRVIWISDLHDKFVAAVEQFGISKAVPKKILEIMNVPGLTRENVASHLQKYRQYHKRAEEHQKYKESLQHQDERAATFLGHQEAQVNRLSSPIDGHNLLAQTTILGGQQLLQAPSLMPQEIGYRSLTISPAGSSNMFEFEMSQQAINCRKLETSDHHQDHLINNTYESKPTVPLLNQLFPEQSITEHGSTFLSLPSASLEAISIANPNGAYYNEHESQVQMNTFDDFVMNNDVSAASMFASFKEMATNDIVEGNRYEHHGHESILQDGNDNKMHYPMSFDDPLIDSKVNETELHWDDVLEERSFVDMGITSTIGEQCDYTSSGNFDHRIQNNSLEDGFDLSFDHPVDSFNLNELRMELLEQQGVGVFQQVPNFPTGEEQQL